MFEQKLVDETDSLTNYNVEIKSGLEGRGEETSALLWILDSKDTSCMGVKKSYGCVGEKQINWYKR